MTKRSSYDELMAPGLLVVGIFAIYLSLTYLPLSSWGITIPTGNLWIYMPWLIVLAIAICILKELWGRR